MLRYFFLVFIAGVYAQYKCPQGTGFFPDPEECDLYYICSKGSYEERLCPDGLVFDDSDPNTERCDIPANVDCKDRPILQEAKPSPGCPRANGYYRHPTDCNKFHNCIDGIPKEISCPPGLAYDDIISTCTWPKNIKRAECFKPRRETLEDGFECPEGETQTNDGRKLPHPTFAHPDDCQKFYICRDGVTPQRGSCSSGKVYNEDTFTCDDPANVPGCENYYSGKTSYAGAKKNN
ncbi:cuticular protein analogous to peritrophins 3-A2 [Leptinotarsa decemlineata]|uniref:cuticular protein analogous to peritrophins 3-A2 n=1 Tax=Leptinotarsa decemlineata TaxID=7539 RepID=UPI003D30D05D